MNVAPAFGTIETMALLELIEVEKQFAKFNMIKEPSNLENVIKYESIHSMKWKKWLTDEVDMSDLDNLDEAMSKADYGIDVSSGVETNGIKDRNKIIEIVRRTKNGNR